MGQGLSKNSPIQLSFGRENYEALLERHGQWVRWRIATKCPCVQSETMQPDIHCKKCGGLGLTYKIQETVTVTHTVMVKDLSGIIELEKEYSDCALIKCYDSLGRIYEKAIKEDCFLMLGDIPEKGSYVTAVMLKNLIQTKSHVVCSSLGNGFYRVDGLKYSKPNIEGLYHTVSGDIESIDKIVDEDGNLFQISDIRQDCFMVKPLEVKKVDDDGKESLSVIHPPENLYAENVRYIAPFVFALSQQIANKIDFAKLEAINGDAILTFPYNYDVGIDDVITVLSGSYIQKAVIVKKEADYDIIPAYFVEEIVNVIGRDREYLQGADFLLSGANYLKWLCVDAPEDGESYSITFKINPTYKVVKSIPQIRMNENQRLPKKAIIKLYETYGEARGVNRK